MKNMMQDSSVFEKNDVRTPTQKTEIYEIETTKIDQKILFTPPTVPRKIEPETVKYSNSSISDNAIQEHGCEKSVQNLHIAENKTTTKNEHLSPTVKLYRIDPSVLKDRNSSAFNIIQEHGSEKSTQNSFFGVLQSSPSGAVKNKTIAINSWSPLVMLHRIEHFTLKDTCSSAFKSIMQEHGLEKSAQNTLSDISQSSPSGTVENRAFTENEGSFLVTLHRNDPSALNSATIDDNIQKRDLEKTAQNSPTRLSLSNLPSTVGNKTVFKDKRQSLCYMEHKLKAVEKRILNLESNPKQSSSEPSNKINSKDGTDSKLANSSASHSNIDLSNRFSPMQQESITVVTNSKELNNNEEKPIMVSDRKKSIRELVNKSCEEEEGNAVLNRLEPVYSGVDNQTSAVVSTNEMCHICDTCNEYVDIINNDLDFSVQKHNLTSRHKDKEAIFRRVSDSFIFHGTAKVNAAGTKLDQLKSPVGLTTVNVEPTPIALISLPSNKDINLGSNLNQMSQKRSYAEAIGNSSEACTANDVSNDKKRVHDSSITGGTMKPNNEKVNFRFCDLCNFSMTSVNYETHLKGEKHRIKLRERKIKNVSTQEDVKHGYLNSESDFVTTQKKKKFCHVCNLSLFNKHEFEAHVRSVKHKSEVKFMHEKMNESERFIQTKNGLKWCSLCKIQCPGLSQLVAHVRSSRHCTILSRTNY